MRKVTKIDAASNAVLAQRKLRVAAYCRVSTDSDELFLQYAEGITVFSPTEVGFRLKCGLTLRERMER